LSVGLIVVLWGPSYRGANDTEGGHRGQANLD